MNKANLILIITVSVFIIAGTTVLFMAPNKKSLNKDVNARVKAAKRDQWNYRN